MVIDVIALLKNRPQRDLGVMYEKNNHKGSKYSMSIGDSMDSNSRWSINAQNSARTALSVRKLSSIIMFTRRCNSPVAWR
jgi:hypothetical protein